MPKAYPHFKFDDLTDLGLKFERKPVVGTISVVQPSQTLTDVLTSNLALPLGSEKAKSEFLITPILSEIRRQSPGAFTFFSGYKFNVDKSKGLYGRCD